MKRLVWLLLVVVVAFVAAERVPALHDRLPWLPDVPWLTMAAPDAAKTDDASTGASGTGDRRAGGPGGRRRGAPDGPIPVLVASVETADMPVTAEVLGTVQATNNVTVRSQVDGKLLELAFRDGQDVAKGDVLARIDPATFQAAYDQAVAKKAQDEAALANAQADLVRYAKLAATQYGSVQQADTQKAQVAQSKALIAQDQAALDNARTTLEFATIRAPISGRTGIRLVDAGNVIRSSDTTGIVTVAEVKPIAAIFNLPQQLLSRINAAQAAGPPLRLEAFSPDTHEVIDTGILQVVDNTVEQTTGTVRLKGSFPNAALQLWPGQFVNLRLTISVDKNVVVVPTPAIQRGPSGPFVFQLKPDGTVQLQKVTVGRQTEDRSIITAGLAPPAQVVTTGFTRLTDGAKVAVSQATAAADGNQATPAPAPEEAGRRRQRRGDTAGQGNGSGTRQN